MNKIYLDNASTTAINSEVLTEMMPYFNSVYGNASSLHSFGRDAKDATEQARQKIASAIGCLPSEIYFTSGATEANNWAIKGIAHANSKKGKHIITSKVEHESVLKACEELEKEGYKVTYLDVDKYGLVRLDQLLHNINKDTTLISIMSANNEIGTIQNIQTIANIAREKGVYFHTDATQAIGSVNISVNDMKIDALSLSGHKIYGPKGVGALFLRNGVAIEKFMVGGEQEKNLRAGTLNTPAIVGLGKAVEIACRDIIANAKKMSSLRNYFIKEVQSKIDMAFLNGHPIQRLPNNINFSFGMVEGESVMYMLDMQGIAVSTGSACSSGSVEDSHVLKALGLAEDLVKGGVRFTLSKSTTKEELDIVVEELQKVIKKLRKISPITKAQVGKLKK
ncbi:MAG: cysteine desulfurase NifS [Clostridia bacterium]|nr:cysteine desulfurase NifS [Clostridia bacterium]